MVLDNVVCRKRHIRRVCADDDDVVRVVGNRSSDRAGLEAVALNVAKTNMSGVLVPLNDGDFQDILFQIHMVGVAVVGRDDLARNHADHAALPHILEVFLREMADMERVVRPLVQIFLDCGCGEILELAVIIIQLALFENHFDVKILEIIDDCEIGQIPGSNCAAVIEQEVARRVVAGDLDGQDRVRAVLVDGLAADIVDVPLLQKIVRVLVVRAEHAALGVLRGK